MSRRGKHMDRDSRLVIARAEGWRVGVGNGSDP